MDEELTQNGDFEQAKFIKETLLTPHRVSPSFLTDFSTSEWTTNKLEGLIPGTDINQQIAERQSWGEKVGNGTLRLVSGTVLDILQAAAMLTSAGMYSLATPMQQAGYDLLNPKYGDTKDLDFLTRTLLFATDNFAVNALSKAQDWVKEQLPIYKTNQYQNMSLFQKALKVDFWADEFNEGLQFFLSALIPGLLLSKVSKVSKLTPLILGLANENKILTPVAKGIAGVVQKAPLALYMTASESLYETKDAREQLFEKYIPLVERGEINPNTGKQWTIEDATKIIGNSLKDVFKSNMAALALSSFIEADMILGKAFSRGGKIAFDVNKYSKRVPKTAMGRFFNSPVVNTLGQIGKGVITEGLWEENIQHSIQDVAMRSAAIAAETGREFSFGEKALASLSTLTDFRDKERGESVFIGSLLGGGLGTLTHAAERSRENKTLKSNIAMLQQSYDALLGVDIYKKQEGNTITVEKKQEGDSTVYYRTIKTPDGAETKTPISKSSAEEFASLHNGDLEKGAVTWKEPDRYEFDSDGRLVLDRDKVSNFVASTKFIREMEDLLDMENSKDKRNERRAKFLFDTMFNNWALAHFSAKEPDLLYEKLKYWSNISTEEAMQLGYNPAVIEHVKADLPKRMAKLKKLERVWDNIDNTFVPSSNKRDDIVNNLYRKKDAFRTKATMLTIEELIGDEINKRDELLKELNATDILLNEINQKAYLLQYEQMRLARLQNKTRKKDIDALEKLSKEIIDMKREYNSVSEKKIAEDDSVVYYANLENSVEAEKQSAVIADLQSAHNMLSERYREIEKDKDYKRSKYADEEVIKSKMNITDGTTVEDYKDYENKRSARERFVSNIDNIRTHYISSLLEGRIDEGENLSDILKDIITGKLKLSQNAFKNLSLRIDEIRGKKDKKEKYRDKIDQYNTASAYFDDTEEDTGLGLLPEEELEYRDLVQDDEKNNYDNILSLWDEITKNKNDYVGEVRVYTDAELKKKLLNEYIDDAEQLLWLYNNNPNYIDQGGELPLAIKRLENLKRIISDEKYTTLTDNEKKEFSDRIDSYLEKMKDAIEEINKRRHDVEVKDAVITEEHVGGLYGAIGVSFEAKEGTSGETFSVEDRELYDAIENAIGSIKKLVESKSIAGIETIFNKIGALRKTDSEAYEKIMSLIEKRRRNIEQGISSLGREDIFIESKEGSPDPVTINMIWDNPRYYLMFYIFRNIGVSSRYDRDNPLNKFQKEKIFSRLVDNIRNSDIDNKDKLIMLLSYVNQMSFLKDAYNMITLENYSSHYQTVLEYDYAKRLLEDNPNETHALTNEQRIALHDMLISLNRSFYKSMPFGGWTLLEGFAGTGKTNVLMRWLMRAIGLNGSNSIVSGSTETSAITIRNSLFTDHTVKSTTVSELIQMLKDGKIDSKIKYIVIDEIGQVTLEDILTLRDLIMKENEIRKDPLYTIVLGDPNQVTAVPTFAPLNDYTRNNRRFENIFRARPLTILHRSRVPALNEVIDAFIDNPNDIASDGIRASSTTNNPWNNSTPLFGVNGNFDFVRSVKGILANRLGFDTLTRAIIVSDNLIDEYKNTFADEISKGVQLLTYSQAQSMTFDEVYVNIDRKYVSDAVGYNSIKEITNLAYNAVLYTAASRARNYVFLGDVNIIHIENPNIAPVVKEDETKANLTKFRDERAKDIALIEEALGYDTTPTKEDEKEDTEEKEEEEEKEDTSYESTESEEDDIIEVDDEELTDDLGMASTDDTDEINVDNTDKTIKEASAILSPSPSNLNFTHYEIYEPSSIFDVVRKGTKVMVVVTSYEDPVTREKKRKLIVVQKARYAGKDIYREVAVISKNDLPGKGQEKLYEKFYRLLDEKPQDTDAVLTAYGTGERHYAIENLSKDNIVAEGVVREARKRKFLYSRANIDINKGSNKKHILERIFDTQYPKAVYGKVWGKDYALIRKETIKFWSDNSEWKVFGKKRDTGEIKEGLKRGWPYLIISNTGLRGKDGFEQKSGKPMFIRMSWKKLSHDDNLVKNIKDFIAAMEKLEALLTNKNPDFKYGNPVFNRIVRSIARNELDKDILKDIKDEKRKEEVQKDLLSLFGVTKDDVEGDYTIRNLYKAKYNEELVVNPNIEVLSKTVYDMCYTTENEKTMPNGYVQVALNKIAKANIFSNGIILRNITKVPYDRGVRKHVSGRALLSDGFGLSRDAIKEAKKRIEEKIKYLEDRDDLDHSSYIALLKEQLKLLDLSFGHFTLKQLKLAFDETMNLVTPVSAYHFNKEDSSKVSIKLIEDTFVGIVPSNLTVNWFVEEKPEEVREGQKPEVKKERYSKTDDEIDGNVGETMNINKNKRGQKRAATSLSDNAKMSVEKAKKYIKKLIPSISDKEIGFIDEDRILMLNDGKEAYGLFIDGVIYLLEDKDGTVYMRVARHEVFHKIWNEFVQSDMRDAVLSELIKMDAGYKRLSTESLEEYEERIDEALATMFQDYKNGKRTFFGVIKEFFEKLLRTLGFIRDNRNEIEKLFDMIEAGKFTDRLEESLEDRTISDLNEYSVPHVDRYTVYEYAKRYVINRMSYYLNPSRTVEDKDAPGKYHDVYESYVDEDGNVYDVPATFNEAKEKLFNRLMFLAKKLPDDVIADGEIMDYQKYLNYHIAKILTKTDIHGRLTNLNNIMKEVFPMGKFDMEVETVDESEQNAEERVDEELETEGIIRLKETDEINPFTRASYKIRLFLSNITYTDSNGVKRVIPFKLGFRKFIDIFSDFAWDKDVFEQRKRVNESIKSLSPLNNKMKEVAIRLIDMANERLPENMRFDSEDKFAYSNKLKSIKDKVPENYTGNINVIERGTMDTAEFFVHILDTLGMELNTKNINLIRKLYDQHIAQETLREIQVAVGSLYEQHIRKGQFRNVPGDFRYRYVSNVHRDVGTKIKEELMNKVYSRLIVYGKDYFKKIYSVTSGISEDTPLDKQIDALNSIAIFFGYDSAAHSDPYSVIRAFNDIIEYINSANLNDRDAIFDEIFNNHSGHFSRIEKAITHDLPSDDVGVNYVRGDGKKSYLFVLSNYAMDVIRNIANYIRNIDKPSILKTFDFLHSEFYKYNPLNPVGHYSVDNVKRINKREFINTIYDYENYDSTFSMSGNMASKRVDNEDRVDIYRRNFAIMFLGQVLNAAKSLKNGLLTYSQPVFVIGERRRIIAATMNFIDENSVRRAIASAIEQETKREHHDVVEYTKNMNNSYILGLDSVFKAKEPMESEESYRKRLDLEVDKVIKALNEKADALFDKFSGVFIGSTSDIVNAINVISGIKNGIYGINKFEGMWNTEEGKKKLQDTLKDLFRLYYKNYYINGHFLNQMIVGDYAFYFDSDDILKRIQLAFSDGYKPVVGGKFGMREKFRVAVSDDIKMYFTEERWKKFNKIYGDMINATDGAGFMTDERYYDITKRGLPAVFNLGDVLKSSYFGKDANGVPRSLKYSCLRLSKELVKEWPELKNLVKDMKDNNVDEYVFLSSMKTGAPNTYMSTKNTGMKLPKIKQDAIVELDNNNYRVILNPKKGVDITTKLPTQLMYMINNDGNNTEEANVIFENTATIIRTRRTNLIKRLRLYGRNEYNTEDENSLKNIHRLRMSVARSIKDIPALTRVYDLLVSKTNNKYDVSINLPVISEKMAISFASLFRRNVMEIRFNGADLILQPEVIADKKLNIRNERGNMEVLLPDIYQGKVNKGDVLYGGKGSKIVGFRIPTTGKHSAAALEVVGFFPSSNQNIIIVPSEFTYTSGTDFDIDTLFIIRKSMAQKDYYLYDYDPLQQIYKKIKKVAQKGEFVKSGNITDKDNIASAILRNIEKLRAAGAKQSVIDELSEVLEMSLMNGIVEQFHTALSRSSNDEAVMLPILMERIKRKHKKGRGIGDGIIDLMDKSKKKIYKSYKPGNYDINLIENQMDVQVNAHDARMLKGFFVSLQRGLLYIHQAVVQNNPFAGKLVKRYYYHGGTIGVDELFKEEMQKPAKYLKGFYFTSDVETASGYAAKSGAEGNIRKVILDIKRPLQISENGKFVKIKKANRRVVEEINNELRKRYDNPEYDIVKDKKLKNLFSVLKEADNIGVDVKAILKKLNYDSLAIEPHEGEIRDAHGKYLVKNNAGQTQYVVFDESNIIDANTIQNVDEPLLEKGKNISVNNFVYDRLYRNERDGNGDRNTVINEVDGEKVTHNFSVSENLDIMVNMAIDSLKLQYFNRLNVNKKTARYYAGLISLGIPLDTVFTIMNNPVMIYYGANAVSMRNIHSAIYNSISDQTLRADYDAVVSEDGYVPNIEVKEYDLDMTYNDLLKADDITKLKYLHTINALMRVYDISSDISKVAGATRMLSKMDTQYHNIQRLMEYFDEIFSYHDRNKYTPLEGTTNQYELKPSFSFRNVQILSLPHIKESFETLKLVKTKTENIFYKHNKDLTEFSTKVYNWLTSNKSTINLSSTPGYSATTKNETIQRINEEFIRYLLSGVRYEDGYTYDTSNEEPYVIKVKDKEDRTVYGLEAWSQRFVDKVEKIKEIIPDNKFVEMLLIRPNRMNLRGISMPSISQMDPVEVRNMQYHFESMLESLKDEDGSWLEGFEDIDRDFVKYATLNFGLYASAMNYTAAIPSRLFSESTRYIDNVLYDLYQMDKKSRANFFNNVMKHFAMQLALNRADSVYPDYRFLKGIEKEDAKDEKYDTINGKGIVYSLKMKKKDENERDVPYETFPQLLKIGTDFYYKMLDVSDEYVYYSTVGFIDYHAGYQYNEDVARKGYEPDILFDGRYKILSHVGTLDDTISITFKRTPRFNINKGTTVIVKQKSDLTGVNAAYYTIEDTAGNTIKLRKKDNVFSYNSEVSVGSLETKREGFEDIEVEQSVIRGIENLEIDYNILREKNISDELLKEIAALEREVRFLRKKYKSNYNPRLMELEKGIKFLKSSHLENYKDAINEFAERFHLSEDEINILKSLSRSNINFKATVEEFNKYRGTKYWATYTMKLFDYFVYTHRDITVERVANYDYLISKLEDHGLEEEKVYNVDDIDDYIDRFGDKQTVFMWNTIKDTAKKLGVTFRIVEKFSVDTMPSAVGIYINGKIEISLSIFRYPFLAASTIVHEYLHGVTTYIFRAVEKNNTKVLEKLTPEQINAVRRLEKLFDELSKDKRFEHVYGASSSHEIISELTNPDFVDLLKRKSTMEARNIIEKIIRAILELFRVSKNAYKEAFDALEDMLSNPIVEGRYKGDPQEHFILYSLSPRGKNMFQSQIKAIREDFSSETTKDISVEKSLLKNALNTFDGFVKSLKGSDMNPELKKGKIDIDEIVDREVRYTDEDGNPCASAGGRKAKFTKGSQWEIVEDLKGYPSHAEGGVDIVIDKDGVGFKRGDSIIRAADGLVLPNNFDNSIDANIIHRTD